MKVILKVKVIDKVMFFFRRIGEIPVKFSDKV